MTQLRKLGVAGFLAALFVVGAQPVLAAPEITYDDILAAPDDPQLSYRYARQEARRGNLSQAAGTLERMLLLQPNWDTARLFYGVVLYRLGDMKGAQREFDKLEGRPLSSAQEEERARYSALATAKARNTRVTGHISLGGRIDSNPRLVSGEDDPFFSGTDERVDGAFIAAGRLRIEHTFPTSHSVYLQMMGNLREWFEEDAADFGSAGVAAGAKLRFGDLVVNPELHYEMLAFDYDPFSQQYGGSLSFDYTVNTELTLFAEAVKEYQEYDDDDDDRDGWKYGGAAGFRAQLWQRNRLTARAGYFRKDADDGHAAYDELALYLGDRQQLSGGQYLLGQAWYSNVRYDDPDPSFMDPGREDDRYRFRLAYGVPLRTAFGAAGVTLPKGVADIVFELSGSHYIRESNISNFDAHSTSGQFLFTKSFAF
jgi:hypothetical protein